MFLPPALSRFVARLARLGVEPHDTLEVLAWKAVLNVGLVIAITVLVPLGLMYWAFGEVLASAAFFAVSFGGLLHLVLVALWPSNYRLLMDVLAVLALAAHLMATLALGGFTNAGGIMLWGMVFPVTIMLMAYGPRRAAWWFAAYTLNLLLGIFLPQRSTTFIPPLLAQAVFAVNLMVISGFLLFPIAFFFAQRNLAFRLLRSEQEKAETLLLNILPPEIANILKNEPRTIAEQFEGASVLFADVVNFTPMSAKMTPVELVELLNEVFTHFDALVEKYGLEKIKTIGDCYMVASGVPRPRPDHAQALTRMALEMQAYVQHRQFRGQTLSFRIGINSGPVVAGVIGRKKFIYDLWGDAVNTASRMESHGQGNSIQITRATYELIHSEFVCEPRGTVQVKGKGELEVWFVTGSH